MKRIGLLFVLILALAVLPACGGSGGGGDSSSASSLVGSWSRTSATNSPGAMVALTFNGSASGGTVTGTRRDGSAMNGNWSLSGETFRGWGGNIGSEVNARVVFTDNNNFQLIEADGTSTWRRR